MTAAPLLGLVWACVVGVWVAQLPVVHRLPAATGSRSPVGHPSRGRSAGARRSVRLVAVAVGVGVVGVMQPLLLAVGVVAVLAAPRLQGRLHHRRDEDALVDQLPDVVDLLRLAVDAGLPVAGALTMVRDRPGGPLGAALAHSAAMLGQGASTADALRALAERAGPSARSLVEALSDHDRYGTPLGPVLDRVGLEARQRRRRRAEEAARRLPVTLLFPLALTTLPAFVLLTVVPLLAGALSTLRP
jgi:tight adherence protein C